jgi:hypothetical protein
MPAPTDVQANAFFCFGSMVNAQPCTMGGIVDYGVGTKSSPRTLAIEKAQEELRYEPIIHLLLDRWLVTGMLTL